MSPFTPSTSSSSSSRWSRVGRFGLLGISLVLVGGVFAACGKTPESAAQLSNTHAASMPMVAAVAPTAHVNLTIVAQKPGSSVTGPSYMPSTLLTVPAHSVVTVTIVNDDAGDTPLPAGSPFGKVTGVIGGSASVDGVPYNALALDKVAHTFTVPGLGVNVPVPGDAPAGHNDITVTFSFKTGGAGTFMWQCMDPCGADPNGWGGPMTMKNYMMGSVTVVG